MRPATAAGDQHGGGPAGLVPDHRKACSLHHGPRQGGRRVRISEPPRRGRAWASLQPRKRKPAAQSRSTPPGNPAAAESWGRHLPEGAWLDGLALACRPLLREMQTGTMPAASAACEIIGEGLPPWDQRQARPGATIINALVESGSIHQTPPPRNLRRGAGTSSPGALWCQATVTFCGGLGS